MEIIENQNFDGPFVRSKQSFYEVVDTVKGTIFRKTDCERAWLPGPDGKGISISRVIHTAVRYPHSSSVPSISYNRPKSTRSKETKKKAKASKDQGRSLSSKMYALLKVVMWTATIGANLWYFSPFNSPNKTNLSWSTDNIAALWSSSLFGQEVAVDKLVSALDATLMTESPAVLLLTGSVGVGKTFATSVLKKTFPWRENLYSYSEKELALSHLVYSLRREPPWTMVVVDDCCKDPEQTMTLATSLLNRAKREEAKLILVIIYTHRTPEELKWFFSSFEPSGVNLFHIPFALLDRDAVRMCFVREVDREGLPHIDHLIDEIVDSQMEFIEEVRATPGCKMIDTKVVHYRQLMRHRSDEL